MSSFTGTKTADPPQAQAPTRAAGKIVLNFGGRASRAVQEMAAATLEAGGFPAEIGDKRPDGTVYAGVSPDTGKAMYTTAADALLTMTFNEAREYASQLDAHSHRDWRVPTKEELNVLFNNRAAIGGFNVSGSNPGGWYWSSSTDGKWYAWTQRFSVGYLVNLYKVGHSSVRCVR